MNQIVFLGTANAIPAIGRENTHLLIRHEQEAILVDCAANPIVHLQRGGVNLEQIHHLILTHFHPDHVSGAPLFLMDLWLLGRTKPLFIYGLEHTLTRLQAMMDLYDWRSWPGFFPLEYRIIPEVEGAALLEMNGLEIISSPVKHLLPTIGIRITFTDLQKTAVYSSDTEPYEAVVRLAKNADVLIHESAGHSIGHSSARQAGEVAQKAGVKSLYLIHYPANVTKEELIREARSVFGGSVFVCEDFMGIDLTKGD
ncbi:MAG: MBL fold metallo-hydrolase [Bellilinea sp.]|nr:MAG: MBL fold metallo-hydrolase [Bellilinea sp.]